MARGGPFHETHGTGGWRTAFWGTLRSERADLFCDLTASGVMTQALTENPEGGPHWRPAPSVRAAAQLWATRWHLNAPWCADAAARTVALWAVWPLGQKLFTPAFPSETAVWGGPPLRVEASWCPLSERWPEFRAKVEAELAEALKSYRAAVEERFALSRGDARHLRWLAAAVVPRHAGEWVPSDYLALAQQFGVSERHMRETIKALASRLELSLSEA